jgi:hypothetical protein
MTSIPLVTLSEERKRRELRRALGHLEPHNTRRFVALTSVCAAWMALGWFLLALSFNLTEPDTAQAAFLAALLVGNGGPAWTLILVYWRKQQY